MIMKNLRKEQDRIFLFDLNGTLTLPHKNISDNMLFALGELLHRGNGDIAIVSSGDFNSVYEQIGRHLLNYSLENRIKILPCNGTQIYCYDNGWQKIYSLSMKEEIGSELYLKLIEGILRYQSIRIKSFPKIPTSSNFISYQGGSINWSLIGKDCSEEERAEFVRDERNIYIRTILLNLLKKNIGSSKIDYALSGQTSISIYPRGWDKTYALTHFKEKECWFFGDNCESGRRDFSLWKKLESSGRAFKTRGPEETIQIIDQLIHIFSRQKGWSNG
ncbi:MAG: HAD hydrolase family protein [Candidatus Lokiarchaeota archaeon]|nr:HAD hydrolase family protein [Candidatus Lokiarchaeota archaeon]